MRIFSLLLLLLLVGCERTVYPDTPPPLVVDMPQYEGNNVFLDGDDDEPFGWSDEDDD